MTISLLNTIPAVPRSIEGGVIATVTLKIIATPPTGGSLTSSISLGTGGVDTILVDPSAAEIPASTYNLVPATFAYGSPPPPWYLRIELEIVAVSTVGDEVTINVSIYDVKAEAKIIGVQFKIVVPEILWTQEEWVYQGPFFESFGDKFLYAIVERDAESRLVVLVFVILLPNPDGTWNSFPEGSGTSATVKFNATSLPENVTKFPLRLSDVIMTDSDGNVVPFLSSKGIAYVIAPAKPEDVNVDLKVDIQDMAAFAVAFGSLPARPKWNPKADVNRDCSIRK